MRTVQQAFELALQQHQAGRLAEAEAIYQQILAAQPNHAEARHFLGVMAYQLGRHALAIEWIQQSIELNPNNATAHSNLGEAYRAIGRPDEAMAAYRRALELQPDHPQAPFNLANALREKSRFDEAITVCQRAFEFHPRAPVAHLSLGNILRDKGNLDEAIASYQRALAIHPGYAEAANNLGVALRKCGRLEEAVAACRHALEIKPGYAEASNNLGNALRDQGCLDEAVTAYRQAIEIDASLNRVQAGELRPNLAEAYLNLGAALGELRQLDAAIDACRRATELRPDLAEAHFNLGAALAERGELDAALAAYQRALELKPGDAQVHINIGNARKDQGQIAEAIAEFRRAQELDPVSIAAHCNVIFALHYDPDADARTIAKEHERWNQKICGPLIESVRPLANDRNAERPLRVGYVSGDFRDHVIGRNVRPLFRHHDHRNFQVFCYAGVARPDWLTAEFRERAECWRSSVGVKDEDLAAMIREDGVDILVDLAQHTAGNRLRMFAGRPAPVQVSFAGYPASAGVEAIQYRIGDRHLESETVALEMGDGSWEIGWKCEPELSTPISEFPPERVFLIDSFWCYDPCGVNLQPNALPAQANGWLTFGSLNNFCKINDSVLKLWARVLGMVKDARLVLLSARGSHRQRTLEMLAEAGVQGDRVEFIEPCARRAYLEVYQRLDMVLDPFPYNGHTTSLDALWMGVPVVSLAGATSVSRAGLSQLSNLGLRDLVAFSEDEYVDIAARLAHDLPRLAALRATLRARMEASVLMDAPRFARGIEAAYRAMWRQWCASGK